MYTAQELANRFEVSVTTIKWYRQIGVIPPPHGRTRAATYGKEHVEALDAYRALIPLRGDRITAACVAERRLAGQL